MEPEQPAAPNGDAHSPTNHQVHISDIPNDCLSLIVGHVAKSYKAETNEELSMRLGATVKCAKQLIPDSRLSPHVWEKEQFFMVRALSLSCGLMNDVIRNFVKGFSNLHIVHELGDKEEYRCPFLGCNKAFEDKKMLYGHTRLHLSDKSDTPVWLTKNGDILRDCLLLEDEIKWRESNSIPLKVALSYPGVDTLKNCTGPALPNLLEATKEHMRTLVLYDDYLVETTKNYVEQIKNMTGSFHQIIYHGKRGFLIELLKRLPPAARSSLRELNITGCSLMPSTLRDILVNCPELTKLTFLRIYWKEQEHIKDLVGDDDFEKNYPTEEAIRCLANSKVKFLGVGDSYDKGVPVIPFQLFAHFGVRLEHFECVVINDCEIRGMSTYLFGGFVESAHLILNGVLVTADAYVERIKRMLQFPCIKLMRILSDQLIDAEIYYIAKLRLAPFAATEFVTGEMEPTDNAQRTEDYQYSEEIPRESSRTRHIE